MKNILKTVYGLLMLLLIWTVLHFAVQSAVIPSPFETIVFFVANFISVLTPHLAASLLRIIVAILLSLIIGLPLGILMGMTKLGDLILSPLIYLAYPIPKIAFLPVFMILFGLGDFSKIFLIFTIIVFQIAIGTRDGIKEIPKEVHLSARSLGLGFSRRMIDVILPGLLPRVLSSLRISSGIAISALFLSENYATTYGIGYYIMNNWVMVDYTAMFAGIIGLSLMGLLIFKLIDIAQRRLCPWV